MADKIIHSRKLLDKEQEVIQPYRSGLFLKQVGQMFDVSFVTIYKLLERFSEPRRSVSEGTKLSCTSERNQSHSQKLKGKPSGAKNKKWKVKDTSRYGLKGAENPAWKGGITPENKKVRNSPEYRMWHSQVFERDRWTCVICRNRKRNGKFVEIHADHIKPFSQYPELRLDINNGNSAYKKF